jgi:hypothetical protein
MADDRDPSDYIILGTTPSPGKVTLSNHDRNQDWDIKTAKGQTGASSSLNGAPVGQFQATFELADEEDFARWEAFQRLIESTTNGPTPTALPIYNPDLARNRYTEVSNGGVGGVIRLSNGGRRVTVKFLEYKPPKPKPIAKAVAKPGAIVPGGGGQFGPPLPPKSDPNADAKRELAELLEEARRP